jgi:hypothetical protein
MIKIPAKLNDEIVFIVDFKYFPHSGAVYAVIIRNDGAIDIAPLIDLQVLLWAEDDRELKLFVPPKVREFVEANIYG